MTPGTVSSNAWLGVRVRFTGFRAASWEYPALAFDATGTVQSVRREEQTGFDFWVKMDTGELVALNMNEIERTPNMRFIGGGEALPKPCASAANAKLCDRETAPCKKEGE